MEILGDRRAWVLIAFPGLILLGFLVEWLVLMPRVAARRPADEVAYWERHVARHPGYVASHVRLGLAYQADRRLADARRAYEEALALDDSWDAAAIGRYSVARALGERELAREQLAAYADRNPRCAVCWYNLVDEYMRLGRLDDAQEMVESLLASGLTITTGIYDVDDFSYEAFVKGGSVYAAAGDLERAIALFRKATRSGADDSRAFVGLVSALISAGRPDEALSALDEAAKRLRAPDDRTRLQLAQLEDRARREGAGPPSAGSNRP